MLKTLNYNATSKHLDNILATAVKYGMDIYTIEGALNDKHLIINDGIYLRRQKPRKYIILDYTSCHIFNMTITLTNSEKAYNDFMIEYDQFMKEFYPDELQKGRSTMIKLNHLQPLESFKSNAWYYGISVTEYNGGTTYSGFDTDFYKVVKEAEKIINDNFNYFSKHDRANVRVLYLYYTENVFNDNDNVLYSLKGE